MSQVPKQLDKDEEDDFEDGYDEEFDEPPKPKRVKMKNVDQRRLDDAIERRTLLKENWLATYEISPGGATIVCLCCGLASANANDILEKYCVFCHEFHSDKLT